MGDSMTPDNAIDQHLREFLQKSNFATTGGVITDLDGTAVHEDRGRIYIPEPVEFGLKQLHSAGRRFILNSRTVCSATLCSAANSGSDLSPTAMSQMSRSMRHALMFVAPLSAA